jgi:hypothetical protein
LCDRNIAAIVDILESLHARPVAECLRLVMALHP